jgi:hypothetical protein
MENKDHRDLLKNIQSSLGIIVIGVILYSSITIIAFGITSTTPSLSTISNNTTLSYVINLTNKGLSPKSDRKIQ